MKAVLSNRIYLSKTKELMDILKDELCYSIPQAQFDTPPLIYYDVTKINSNIVSIPIGRIDLIPKDYEIVDKRILDPVAFPDPKFTLRPDQEEVYNSIEDTCIINAQPGWGKTYVGIAIAAKLGQSTLIITHTVDLRRQWEQEIEKVLGISPGIVGSGKLEFDNPIVVSNTQTLNKHINKVASLYGTVITDECLDYNVQVETKEFGRKKIGTIVNNKTPCEVLSFNEELKEFEYKKVLNYFKNKQENLMIKFIFGNRASLICTLNHSIYVYRNDEITKDIAGNILEDEYVVINKSHKTSNILTKEAKPIILGMVLGDGHLATNKTSVRLRITQGEKQLEYLKYKINIIKDIINTDEYESKSGYKPQNKIYSVSTLCFYDLDNWKEKLYLGTSGNKLNITKDIAELLTIESWSIMYMDDGTISKGKSIRFSFCELTEKSINLLINSLTTLFNIIKPTIITCNKGFKYLSLGYSDSEKFINKIAHLIHPDLGYKKGEYGIGISFIGIDSIKVVENFSVQKVLDIDFKEATGGNRYNIEVEDNHNYIANNKLVANCHHLPANSFKNLIDKSKARYKIGLSATLQRKDGKHVFLRDYIGGETYIPIEENKVAPTIHIIKSDIKLHARLSVPWATTINKLTSDINYLNLVVNLAKAYAELGHKVLVVSDRTDFINVCAESTNNSLAITSHTENRKTEVNRINIDIDILYAAISMFKEGIDIPILSCVILATPIGNNEPMLVQIIGRITRPHKIKEKLKPIVVDINLAGNTAKRQASSRLGTYINSGYRIEDL